MPYITKRRRLALDDDPSPGLYCENAGELTYVLQQRVHEYIRNQGVSYQTFAEILGALEGLKIDLTRRLIEPYEQRKQAENGEVWSLQVRHSANGPV